MTVSLQTAPMTDDALAALGLEADEAFYTVDTPLLWGRVMPDRSLMVGRETLPFPRQPDQRALKDGLTEAGARLCGRVRGLHQRCSSIAIRNTWTGPLARNRDRASNDRSRPVRTDALVAGGYGVRVAQGFYIGRRAAHKSWRPQGDTVIQNWGIHQNSDVARENF